MAETVGTARCDGLEVLGFETARKGVDIVNNAKIMLIRYVIEHLQQVEFHLHKNTKL